MLCAYVFRADWIYELIQMIRRVHSTHSRDSVTSFLFWHTDKDAYCAAGLTRPVRSRSSPRKDGRWTGRSHSSSDSRSVRSSLRVNDGSTTR